MKIEYGRGPMIGKLVSVMREYAKATGRSNIDPLHESVNAMDYAKGIEFPVDRDTAWGICDEWISFLYEMDQLFRPHIDLSAITREWATETLNRIFN